MSQKVGSIRDRPLRIGVLAVQGAVSEHMTALEQSFIRLDRQGVAVWVRRPEELADVDGLIIPGGESTTISKLIQEFDLFDMIVARAKSGMPIMGTCAGAIVMACQGGKEVEKTKTRLLGLMEMTVDRNAFGRQRESFETQLKIDGFDTPFHAIFIRAPSITSVQADSKVLATIGERIVLAKKKNLLVCAFHPELSGDTRLHELFLRPLL